MVYIIYGFYVNGGMNPAMLQHFGFLLLTNCNVTLRKLFVAHSPRNFAPLSGIQRFILTFTRTRGLSVFCGESNQLLYPVSSKFVLIFFYYLGLGLSVRFFLYYSRLKFCMHLSCLSCILHTSPMAYAEV